MKKVLITGINGFAGSHLADYILDNKLAEVHGTYRGKSTDFSNIDHIKDKISLYKCDINDYFASKIFKLPRIFDSSVCFGDFQDSGT